MTKMKGICRNTDSCIKARNRDIQEVDDSNFNCEECGIPMEPYPDTDSVDDVDIASSSYDSKDNRPSGKLIVIFIVIGILGVIAVILFYIFERRRDIAVDDYGIAPAQQAITTSAVTGGMVEYPYGTYTGTFDKDGRPDGMGSLLYRRRERIRDRIEEREVHTKDRIEYAEPGQMLVGNWHVGNLVDGHLFDDKGNMIATYKSGNDADVTDHAGEIVFHHGIYRGGLKNGVPDGYGRLMYRVRERVMEGDSIRYAKPGEYVIGKWRRGYLMQGNLYGDNGTLLQNFDVGDSYVDFHKELRDDR